MKKTNFILLFTLTLGLTFTSCSEEEEPVTPGGGNNTPTEDYITVNTTTFKKADMDSVKILVSGSNDSTLKVFVENGFVELVHDKIVEEKAYQGFWVPEGEKTVRVWSRLGYNVGDPNFFPTTPNGTYTIKRINGKRVSVFENIVCEDGSANKQYTISGRVTWP